MLRALQIMAFTCTVALLTGCSAPEKNDALWQQVKITDISPSRSSKLAGSGSLKTINFNILVFEIPAEDANALDNVWPILYTQPLQFNDYEAFSANSFLAGFGQVRMWNEIADLLRTAGAKKIETILVLLPDGQADDVTIARLNNKQTIFCVSTAGSMEGATIGPGELSLRIKAEKIPGSRGVCKVDIVPAFPSSVTTLIPQLAKREKSRELLFPCCGFSSKMSPGDFIFLGSKKYIDSQITLAGLFFSRPGRKPVVRAYLLVCAGINY